MSNRRDRFRKEMAAFEGSADPRRSLDSGHYVSHPRKSLADTIASRIELRPTSTHLLIGGIGSGKTTELLVARDRINKLEDTYAHYIDVSLYADISQIQPGVLLAVAGLALSELTKEIDDGELRIYKDVIRKLAYGYDEKKVSKVQLGFSSIISPTSTYYVHHKGIINLNEGKIKIKQLLEAIDSLKQAAAEKYGHIVLLLDGLDRLHPPDTLAQIVPDVKTLSEHGIGVVLVGPIETAHSQDINFIETTVEKISYQPCFDVVQDPDARDFFAKILAVRASEDFIEQASADNLIYYSGGVLRDLIGLTQASIEEAYMCGSDNLQTAHVQVAVNVFSRPKIFGLSDEEVKILKQVSKEGKFIPRTEQEIRLLGSQRILEYRHPEIRYAVHPAIEPLIETISV
ncbi:MAG: hypothetical protein F6J93_13575 [Oscillatoria sp. SIO1A7]|nr:hypothetical protein [Oscillatoria sp. SIO1A7]